MDATKLLNLGNDFELAGGFWIIAGGYMLIAALAVLQALQ